MDDRERLTIFEPKATTIRVVASLTVWGAILFVIAMT